MKKLLVALFLVLILGLGIFGYSQTTNHPGEIMNHNNYSSVLEAE